MEQSPFQRLFSLGNVLAFSRKASLTVGVTQLAMRAGLTTGVLVLPSVLRAPAARYLLLPALHWCSEA